LPESPVQDVVMRNVKIKAGTGLSVGFASVTGHGVVIEAAKGNAIEKMTGADVKMQ
jgi:hypothetical protein